MSQIMGNPALGAGRLWHHVSAENRTLGKLATRIAQVLMGKHKPIFDRGSDVGDFVVVTQCEKVFLNGRKPQQKTYFKQSTYPGNSKHQHYKLVMERRPEDIITNAVSRMLPKNDLRFRRLNRLKVFQGDLNPYAPNIIRRYDLSPDGGWEGKDSVPAGTSDKQSSKFEHKRRKEKW